jgi:uncharacterized membrane protein YccF (DUF307 family)
VALLGNILWFIFGLGFLACIGWALCGLLLCCTIVGIPFGIAAFRIAGFAAFPFGKDLVDARLLGEGRILGTTLANILWVLLAGLWLAISHIGAAITCFISIIGIPFGLAHLKLAMVSFAPLGKRTISSDLASLAHRQRLSPTT